MAQGGDKQLLRPFLNGDYEMYKSWWDDIPPTLKDLPSTGFVYDDKAVCFMAVTDCSFSILTFWYAKPNISPKDKHTALSEVIKACIAASIFNGKNKIFCYTPNRGIAKILERMGFVNYDGHLIGDYNG